MPLMITVLEDRCVPAHLLGFCGPQPEYHPPVAVVNPSQLPAIDLSATPDITDATPIVNPAEPPPIDFTAHRPVPDGFVGPIQPQNESGTMRSSPNLVTEFTKRLVVAARSSNAIDGDTVYRYAIVTGLDDGYHDNFEEFGTLSSREEIDQLAKDYGIDLRKGWGTIGCGPDFTLTRHSYNLPS